MKVVIDTTVLLYFFDETVSAPEDPSTKKKFDRCQERVNHLIEILTNSGDKVIIPTPVLAEILVKAGNATNEWLAKISRNKFFEIVDFDTRAAIEFAAVWGSRPKPAEEEKRKMKFDDQILAISRVAGADLIYSADDNLGKKVASWQKHVSLFKLPLPPEAAQTELPL